MIQVSAAMLWMFVSFSPVAKETQLCVFIYSLAFPPMKSLLTYSAHFVYKGIKFTEDIKERHKVVVTEKLLFTPLEVIAGVEAFDKYVIYIYYTLKEYKYILVKSTVNTAMRLVYLNFRLSCSLDHVDE